jgi:hypothetical protein
MKLKIHYLTEKYPTILIFVDGESLSDLLIEPGMAVRYDGGKKTHGWCE